MGRRTKGEIEAAISRAIVQFEAEQPRGGPACQHHSDAALDASTERLHYGVVTHNHQRAELKDLREDAQNHFKSLRDNPIDVLRHIGSPFAFLQA